MLSRRFFNDIIILTIFPHLFSLFYSYVDKIYSSLIFFVTLSSLLWHLEREKNKTLLLIDYTLASSLCIYEIKLGYEYNFFYLVIYLNGILALINKLILYLSINKKINYRLWHYIFHILSSLKTIILSNLLANNV
jgi:hypothetical protein